MRSVLSLQYLRNHAPQRARRDGFLPHPAEPRDRARQPDRDLRHSSLRLTEAYWYRVSSLQYLQGGPEVDSRRPIR